MSLLRKGALKDGFHLGGAEREEQGKENFERPKKRVKSGEKNEDREFRPENFCKEKNLHTKRKKWGIKIRNPTSEGGGTLMGGEFFRNESGETT